MGQKLHALNGQHGFCSAARGSDLLFIEEMLRRHAKVHVFLPFSRADFMSSSVGYGWNERYNKALHNTDVEVMVLADRRPADHDQENAAYAACNAAIFEAAIAQARLAGTKPILLAVWNGNPGDGTGGTADAVRNWKSQGNLVEVIDISNL
jgi:hypothetical protein